MWLCLLRRRLQCGDVLTEAAKQEGLVVAVAACVTVAAEMEVVAVLLLLASPTDGTTILLWLFHHN